MVVAFLSLAVTIPLQAHIGPPFPILEHKQVGRFIISLWTHPDLGTGTFFVIVDPAPGTTLPNDLKARVAVQPETGRLPERSYDMWRDPVRDQVQFDNNVVEFDQQEYWRVRLILESSAGGGEILSRVEPTPTGLGKWDLALYTLPFAFIAYMWHRGISRRKKQMRKRAEARKAAEVATLAAPGSPRQGN